jgi:RNA polymerase sigma factor (sigma-70 family)
VVPPVLTDRSFDAVYRDARPGLVRLAYLIVGSQPVAEELVQEAFLRLHQHFAEVENPGGYLRVALVRLCVTANRRRAMEAERLERAVDRVGPPEHEIDEMWTAVQRLRPERRAVLVLRYYEDLPHEEIARLLDCPVVTVRTRARRALADLRKELQQ